MKNKIMPLKITSRPHSFRAGRVYNLSFGNLDVISAEDEYTAEKRLKSLKDQDADTPQGFMNLYNSLSLSEQLQSGIDEYTIRNINLLAIEEKAAK